MVAGQADQPIFDGIVMEKQERRMANRATAGDH